ncbi:hypothetical protein [Pseudonocardia sp. MH-G8]|uniref:hypothetical protein n=1 Tax=Pseudonocardia sp. MH-G8 TaxID=1854588 RepID=UPI000B9F9F76|nr:hypothetical protein [Pseudonocardia sp. MH-G8]OZM80747.1 hypothetical protein CFP66_18525 [Pseudonocardia sp. MH-G8]
MTGDFREIGRRLSNWGSWDVDGRRDVRGTTSLDATPAAQGTEVRAGDVFMAAPPIRFRRALGSPINPLAVK